MRCKLWVGDAPEAELMMPRRPPMEPRMVTVMPYTRQKYDGMVWICKPLNTCQDSTAWTLDAI